MSIEEDIDKAKREAAAKAAEAERLLELHRLYPNLQKRVGRWGKVAYYSKSVIATHYEARHNCGCCEDSPLEIWTYTETPHGPVYTDPPMFTVGEQRWFDDEDPGDNDRPYSGWDQSMIASGIPTNLVEDVRRRYFPSTIKEDI